jgi:hypothetical protein
VRDVPADAGGSHLEVGRVTTVRGIVPRSDLPNGWLRIYLLVIWLDGLHIGNDLVLVAAPGIDDGDDHKHPLRGTSSCSKLDGPICRTYFGRTLHVEREES